MSALWPIHKALVARLKADAALMAVVTGVYDGRAPEGTAMPYIVVGEPTEDAFGMLGGTTFESTLMLHVWSVEPGSSREAYEIADLVDAALAEPLAVAGFTVVAREDFRSLFIEDDGTRHLPIRYRFLSTRAA